MNNNPLQELVDENQKMSERVQYIIEIESYFFSLDDDSKALNLAIEAINKGYSHPLFYYVVGYCYNNGKGGVTQNRAKAGAYFYKAAETRDVNGEYWFEKSANECRIILAEDYVVMNEYQVIDRETAQTYCRLLVNDERYRDDAQSYLSKLQAPASTSRASKNSNSFGRTIKIIIASIIALFILSKILK